MSSSALQKLHAFHRDLNAHALEGARHFTGLNTREIAEYSRRFQESLPKNFEHTEAAFLLKQAHESQILLFGDFHTLRQSQRGFLRFLAQLREQYPGKPLMVALEIFNASDQDLIDDFQTGRIAESAFLKKIDYYNKWGFPWENYQPIVEFCIRNRIRIYGINSQFDSPNRLVRRDEFAAQLLNSWAHQYPNHLCLCLIGEHHLADSHLVHLIDRKHRTVRVVANVDDYALQTLRLPLASSEYLQLAQDFFCIINTAPWLKWQSLSMWEELHANMEAGPYLDEGDLYTEHHYDFDYQLLHISKAINEFLGLGISSSDLTQFDIYIRPDRGTITHLRNKLGLDPFELAALEETMQAGGFYYLSPARAILMQDSSLCHFAEASGHFLYDTLRGSPLQGPQSGLVERVERHVCSTVATLLMNPRHPTLKAGELEHFHALLKRKRLLGHNRTQRDIYRTILSLYEGLMSPLNRMKSLNKAPLFEKDRRLGFALSRQLGEMIGSSLFQQVLVLDEARMLESLQLIFRGSLMEQTDLLRGLLEIGPSYPLSAS